MNKTVYQTNSDGLLVGIVELDDTDKCPLTGGFLMPGGCVEVAPPNFDAGTQTCMYKNGSWVVETCPLPEPETLPTLDELKTAKLRQIDSWTAAAITGGFTSPATGAPYTYDSDATDQDNIKTMYLASLSSAFEADVTYMGRIPIRARAEGATEKTVLLHDKAQMQALVDDMARHIGACKQRGWELQAAANAATTAAELDAVVW